jgi:hypothetical protein
LDRSGTVVGRVVEAFQWDTSTWVDAMVGGRWLEEDLCKEVAIAGNCWNRYSAGNCWNRYGFGFLADAAERRQNEWTPTSELFCLEVSWGGGGKSSPSLISALEVAVLFCFYFRLQAPK